MSTPPEHEAALAQLVRAQIERMRERTRGRLPAEEQEELAALLEDLLRSHPILGRWVEGLLPRADVARTAEMLRAAESAEHQLPKIGATPLVEDGSRPNGARREAAPGARKARAELAAASTAPKKPKKAGGAR